MTIFKTNEARKRYSIFPIAHPDLWDRYKAAEKQTWVAEEMDLSRDSFDELNDQEKLLLKNILSFFNISDSLVIENLAVNFLNNVGILEAQYYYGHQTFIEGVHQNTYSLMTETFIKDPTEKEAMFRAMETNPAVASKARWAEEYINHPDLVTNLYAFAILEGLFFSGLFGLVFWYRSRNKMPGFCDANELILRDEGSHYEFAVNLYNNYVKEEYKLSNDILIGIMKDAYETEIEFIKQSLPDGLKGLTQDMMIQYIQFVSDVVLQDFGADPVFHVSNPLPWMAKIGLSAKNNFFERRVGEYTRVDMSVDLNFDEDF